MVVEEEEEEEDGGGGGREDTHFRNQFYFLPTTNQ
jgi:hypothetical protein